MLQKIRIAAAAIIFSVITLLFLDFSGTLHVWFGWLAKIQFIPALLASNVGIVLFLIVLTLVFGRVYCSVICPLGVFQDIVSWMAGKRKKNRFSYSLLPWLRYGMLALFALGIIFGIASIVTLLEPYSAYGRIASNLFAPVWQWGNNLLAWIAERMNSYAFYSVDVWIKSSITFAIAIITFIAVGALAWKHGRTYCNTICPVGTVLGFLSRHSFFKPVFDTGKCNSCGLCAKNCKASCINVKEHKIDYSRCVTCMNCIEKCNRQAITYKPKTMVVVSKQEPAVGITDVSENTDQSRRKFLSVSALFALSASLKAQERLVDGGLATIEEKKIPNRATPLYPAGSQSAHHFTRHCTSCQLCVSACPNGVLRPSEKLSTFMQPEMSYERGYCRPECTKCAEVCPADAIGHITKAEKSSIQIGHAVWIKENCIVNRDQVQCHSCERHCPAGAILLVAVDADKKDSLKIPVIDTERCIGCGACENLCPSRPFSAIYVEGNVRHRMV